VPAALGDASEFWIVTAFETRHREPGLIVDHEFSDRALRPLCQQATASATVGRGSTMIRLKVRG
jgi:hypothetical protein